MVHPRLTTRLIPLQRDDVTETAQRLALDPFFLHPRLALSFLDPERAREVEQELSQHQPNDKWLEGIAAPTVLTRELEAAISQAGVPELAREHLHGSLTDGQVVGLQQAFYFRRKRGLRRGNGPMRIDFHAQLSTDASVEVGGTFNAQHCVGTSGGGLLSGRRNVYMLGHVTGLEPHRITLRPILIGRRFYGLESVTGRVDLLLAEVKRRVFPTQVQQFSRIAEQQAPSRRELQALRDVPERQVKEWLAEIIGECRVPKDWGGEQSDLYTSRLLVDGEPVSAAFLLKGPARFEPMTIKALGKNGDQIDRLYREPADVLVLQHCHEITTQVISMLDVYAWDARRPRRYMVIDGYDALRLLRAYGKL